jgi:hypothetical protein
MARELLSDSAQIEEGTMTGKQLCIATTHPAVVDYARISGLRIRLTEEGLLKFNSKYSPRFASAAGLAFYCRQRLRALATENGEGR